MLIQSSTVHGALEVLEADLALDRLGGSVLCFVVSCKCHHKQGGEDAREVVRISVERLGPFWHLWRCARASAVLWLRYPFLLIRVLRKGIYEEVVKFVER